MAKHVVEKVISNLIESNVFVVGDAEGCILIDAGVDIKQVKTVVGDRKVLGVFLTHGHYDHAFYAENYAKEFGCKVFCSNDTKEYLENSEYNYSEGEFEVKGFSKFEFLYGEGILKLGNFKLSYHQLGGHSKGDMCFVVGDDIFVGDVLIGRDIGRIDLYGGDKYEMIKSLQFLLKKDYKIIHFGHGLDNSKDSQDKIINLWLRFLSR